MNKGKYQNYFWIEWHNVSISLNDLLDNCPQIALGKYLINTAWDSGSLSLGDEEIKQGWRKHNESTLSPIIEDVSVIQSYGYDEWYVFDKPTYIKDYEVFVNYGGFSLQPETEIYLEISKRFWQQIINLNPESYLAEGCNLIFITKNEKLFEQISSSSKLAI